MNKLDASNETASKWSPYKAETKKFLEDAKLETFNSIARAIVGTNYTTGKMYILFGCVGTGTDPGARTVTAGAVFYNGEIYTVDAFSGTTTGADVLVAKVTDTADPVADPTTFSDNTQYSIHRVRKVVISIGASGSGDANFSDFVARGKIKFTYNSSNQSTSSGTYVDLTGSTYTTPNDGITRNYMILAKTRVHYTNSTGDGGVMRIYAGSELDMNENYRKAQIAPNDVTFTEIAAGLSCQYYGSIAPNTVVKVQVKSSNGVGSIDFQNNSFILIEI